MHTLILKSLYIEQHINELLDLLPAFRYSFQLFVDLEERKPFRFNLLDLSIGILFPMLHKNLSPSVGARIHDTTTIQGPLVLQGGAVTVERLTIR